MRDKQVMIKLVYNRQHLLSPDQTKILNNMRWRNIQWGELTSAGREIIMKMYVRILWSKPYKRVI